MSSPWAVFQAHAKHFGALYRGGAVAREEVQAKRSDGDFLRRANLVDSALQQAETAIEQYEMRSGEHLRLDDWEGDLEVRVEPIQLMLGELRRGLPRTRVASQDHMNFYEGIVKSLEQRTNALNIRLSVQRGEMLSTKARRAAVQRGHVSKQAESEIKVDAAVSLYEEDVSAARPAVEFSAEERAQLQQENAELQEHMHDRTIEEAERIQRQLGELAQIIDKFSIEISVQQEDMNRIIDTVSHSVVNVELGNAQLLEATSTGADFRFFVLMFLVIMSISLLFLHWYS